MKITLNNKRTIGGDSSPYFIAEVNTSHFGDMIKARELIKKAKECGCDCVKFQSWSDSTLYSKEFYSGNPIAKRFVKKFSLNESQLGELADYSNEIGIDFASTPYSNDEVDFLLNKCKAPFIKVASMDINNFPFLRYIAKTGTAIVLSTGMSDFEEIQEAVKVLTEANAKNIAILHCVSIYPANPEIIHLKNIANLQSSFPECSIGYSDHTLGIEVAIASVALGATIVEKHFTLDKTAIGMDNQMAIEQDQLKDLIDLSNNVFKSLGSVERLVGVEEMEQRKKMRRSLIAKEDLLPGDIISEDKLDAKRPGTGISVAQWDKIVGCKVINKIEADTLIKPEDII